MQIKHYRVNQKSFEPPTTCLELRIYNQPVGPVLLRKVGASPPMQILSLTFGELDIGSQLDIYAHDKRPCKADKQNVCDTNFNVIPIPDEDLPTILFTWKKVYSSHNFLSAQRQGERGRHLMGIHWSYRLSKFVPSTLQYL